LPAPWPLQEAAETEPIVAQAADAAGNGSILVDAALIQSRRDYLRLQYEMFEGDVAVVGTSFLALLVLMGISARWLKRVTRRRRSAAS
jgi:hypothetical protein